MKKTFYLSLSLLLFSCCGTAPKEKQIKSLKAEKSPVFMWFDCSANFERLSNADSIDYYLDKCVDVGVTDVVVDIKPISGEVVYPSKIAPRMLDYKGYRRDSAFDELKTFIELGHKKGLRLHASLNIFSGGNNLLQRGIIFGDKEDWQTVCYLPEGIMPVSQVQKLSKYSGKYGGLLNPVNKEVQKYQLSILQEVAGMYPDLDGIILDRGRFDGVHSDFSELSRQEFEQFLGHKIQNFPTDIFEWQKDNNGQYHKKEGKYYKQWLLWRTKVIYDFFVTARQVVKKANPKILYGDYVGAWYPLYYEVGVNWASKKYDPNADYPQWALPEYQNYGYAEELDFLMVGTYFKEVTIAEVRKMNEEGMKLRTEAAMGKGRDDWYSVEGSAKIAKKVVGKATPVYGSIYVEQYGKDLKAANNYKRALKMSRQKTDGLMIFDIVHIINLGWWKQTEQAIKETN